MDGTCCTAWFLVLNHRHFQFRLVTFEVTLWTICKRNPARVEQRQALFLLNEHLYLPGPAKNRIFYRFNFFDNCRAGRLLVLLRAAGIRATSRIGSIAPGLSFGRWPFGLGRKFHSELLCDTATATAPPWSSGSRPGISIRALSVSSFGKDSHSIKQLVVQMKSLLPTAITVHGKQRLKRFQCLHCSFKADRSGLDVVLFCCLS